ncbi:MAG: hypothetical protein M3276_06945, partial [Actinomycetota bacterium]|nr:hypothetical protein [Actinomycetota bacterium]
MPVTPRTRRAAEPAPAASGRTYRREGWALLAVAVWTGYVWVTRAVLLLRDPAADPAAGIHAAITVVSLVSAAVVGAVG